VPRVRLILHARSEPGVEGEMWGYPIYPFGECPHPRMALRFDPRFGLPTSCYCRACGEAYINPFHGLSAEEIEDAKRRGAELYAALVPASQDNDQPQEAEG
jgi:hypothetical protein